MDARSEPWYILKVLEVAGITMLSGRGWGGVDVSAAQDSLEKVGAVCLLNIQVWHMPRMWKDTYFSTEVN